MRRRVLVTGGAGFVGSCLVRQLLDAGAEVQVVDNLCNGRREMLPEAARDALAVCDVREHGSLAAVFRRFEPDGVVHLAALHYIPYCDAHPLETLEVNVGGTRNVLAIAAEVGARRVFLASTGAVYTPSLDAHREDSPLGPRDIYGHSKLVGEDLAELAFRRSGLSVAVGRMFNVFGPGETNPHVVPEVVAQVRRGATAVNVGNTTARRDFVHVRDVARAIAGLVSGDGGFDVFNIGTGASRSVVDLVDVVGRVVGRPIGLVTDPSRLRPVDRPELRAEVSRIRQATGWSPQVAFEAGLAELLRG